MHTYAYKVRDPLSRFISAHNEDGDRGLSACYGIRRVIRRALPWMNHSRDCARVHPSVVSELERKARHLRHAPLTLTIIPPHATIHHQTQTYFLASTYADGQPLNWSLIARLPTLAADFSPLMSAMLMSEQASGGKSGKGGGNGGGKGGKGGKGGGSKGGGSGSVASFFGKENSRTCASAHLGCLGGHNKSELKHALLGRPAFLCDLCVCMHLSLYLCLYLYLCMWCTPVHVACTCTCITGIWHHRTRRFWAAQLRTVCTRGKHVRPHT